ncbi:MAG: response regulator [Deltaproteobacteria bacterium]|nr:response regulator [Deltaproteobacteria bacterium]
MTGTSGTPRRAVMKKILVIDDDPAIVAYLTSLFSDNGYEVVDAADAKEGLEAARAHKPDLITLDLEMPGEWGPRFYRKMSQDPELKNTPVIVISGLSGSQYSISKAAASVSKPFDREKLLGIVKDLLKE